jgi:lauroyl/myristoyl acyltransferase
MNELFDKVREEYGIEIRNEDDMTNAWKLVEALKEKDWVVYIITGRGREQVDAWHPKFGSLFAQFGETPNFGSVLEGICNIALLVRELENKGAV